MFYLGRVPESLWKLQRLSDAQHQYLSAMPLPQGPSLQVGLDDTATADRLRKAAARQDG